MINLPENLLLDFQDINSHCKHQFSEEISLECRKIFENKNLKFNEDYAEFAYYTFSKIKDKNLYIFLVVLSNFLYILDDHLEDNNQGR